MTLDEVLVALQEARKELPGDTPVDMEYESEDYQYWFDRQPVEAISFFPAPKDDTERRITIR